MMFALSDDVIQDIAAFRHNMRNLGQRGACYEVAQYIQWRFGVPAQEGVYQAAGGAPIVLHRWNLLPNGDILDGAADQFCEGADISIIPAGTTLATRYRPIWTCAFNPGTIQWLRDRAWTGLPDKEWWDRNTALPLGWWLADPGPYHAWREVMAARYKSFAGA
jgi:hypothetical protein